MEGLEFMLEYQHIYMAWNIIVESHVKWWLFKKKKKIYVLVKSTWFVCVEVLRPSQPNGVMSSTVCLPNHTFTGQA